MSAAHCMETPWETMGPPGLWLDHRVCRSLGWGQGDNGSWGQRRRHPQLGMSVGSRSQLGVSVGSSSGMGMSVGSRSDWGYHGVMLMGMLLAGRMQDH